MNRDYFRIEDSVVIGGQLEYPVEDMVWITTQKQFEDFELELEIKLLGSDYPEGYLREDEEDDFEERPNSGVWFRCRYDADSMLIGYEADLMVNLDLEETKNDTIWWGSLHDPFRRDFEDFNIVGHQDSLRKVIRFNDWNHFRIYCKGPEIKIWVNQYLSAEFSENDDSIDQQGVIGLQLHDGPPSEVRFRNVMIREL